MPCNSGPDHSDGMSWDERRRLKMVEAVLCGVIRHLTKGHVDDVQWADTVNWKEVGVSKEEAIRWWKEHVDIDRGRS